MRRLDWPRWQKAALMVAVILVAVRVSSSQESPADRFTIVAKRLVAAINAADYEGITREFNPPMRAGFPLIKAKAFFQGLIAKMGPIQRIDAPRLMPPDQVVFLTHFKRGVLDMKIILDEQGRVSGLGFMAVAPSPVTKNQEEARGNETPWRLPLTPECGRSNP